jgi:hypothetical protein
MNRKELEKRKMARVLEELTKNPSASMSRLKTIAEAQEYPTGTRVRYYMSEHPPTHEVSKTGVIIGYQGITLNGKEIYEIRDDKSKIEAHHTIYIIETLEKEHG